MKKKTGLLLLLLMFLLTLVGCGAPKDEATQRSGAKLATLEDLKDKRIGILLGSVHDAYVAKTFPDATVLQYKSPSDLVLAVKTGKVDAAFYTHETLLEILRGDDEIGFLAERIFSVPIGMGFKKGNDELRGQFDLFLRQLKESGVFDDMVRRWILDGTTQMPDIENPKTNGVLTVGIVSDKGMPFTIVKDNRMIGFDVEMAQRFAAYLGKELKLSDMEFGALIPAVSGNKIDQITSTLMITQERKKQIDFSEPYYELGASAFALKKNLAQAQGETNAAVAVSGWQSLADSFHNNIIREKRYLLLLDGLQTTLVLSVSSSFFGTVLGALICFMRMRKNRLVCSSAKVYIALMRGTPVLVLLMLIFYVAFASVDVNPLIAAVLAFALNFAAYVSEMFRTSIESVDKGQTEAGLAGGFSRLQTFVYIVMPQALRQVMPVYKGEFISLVKMTSVVGYIALQDLTKASDIIRSRTFDAFFPIVMVAVLYFIVSWSLALALDYAGAKLDPKQQRKTRRDAL
ncbi:ABC transporter substrate-binding protein/permease [Azotosporobacter soli]|uniref:ABC transporter substrate-binding protein/permease n=1 Tax=Azotosporobacter soli TaxID=3055040 RepID=UPI0031FE702B